MYVSELGSALYFHPITHPTRQSIYITEAADREEPKLFSYERDCEISRIASK